MATGIQRTTSSFITILLAASVITVALSFIPLVRMIVYPFRSLSPSSQKAGTRWRPWLTFGGVESITIYANASGETYTRGGCFVDRQRGLSDPARLRRRLARLGRQLSQREAALTITAR